MHLQHSTVFINDNPPVSGTTQFKPTLFKGHLHAESILNVLGHCKCSVKKVPNVIISFLKYALNTTI